MNRERHTILATKPLIQLTVPYLDNDSGSTNWKPCISLCNIRPGKHLLFKARLRATSIVFLVAVHEDDRDCTYCLCSWMEVLWSLANDIIETCELQ